MINYSLTRSRRRTVAVYVKPDGSVEVRAPIKLSKSKIESFVDSKERWIKQKQAYFTERKQRELKELPPVQYSLVEFERNARELVNMWEQRLDVRATYIGIRKMTSRWGSCTAKTRRIRLNTLLIYCPRECLEYVVVHELAHIKENNHSPRFWKIVAEALPDYKVRQNILKNSSPLLLRHV